MRALLRRTHVECRRSVVARVDEGDELVKDGLLDELFRLVALHGIGAVGLLGLELFELGEDGGLDAFTAALHEEDVHVRLE